MVYRVCRDDHVTRMPAVSVHTHNRQGTRLEQAPDEVWQALRWPVLQTPMNHLRPKDGNSDSHFYAIAHKSQMP